MQKPLDEFNAYRAEMNERLMNADNNKILKRIFSVDTLAYQDGALEDRRICSHRSPSPVHGQYGQNFLKMVL